MNTAQRIAKYLLDVEAVTLSPLEPYTWASGLKSPIYCDNRITMSYPEVRMNIARGLADIVRQKYQFVDMIVGTATAGIPQACWVSEALALPMAYVRVAAKDHGRSKQIEGFIPEKSKVIVIEDLISTGGSSIKACKVLEEAGHEVVAVLSVFDYELDSARQNFENAGIPYESLSNYSTLIDVAVSSGTISQSDLASLKAWRQDPQAYTEAHQ